MSSILADLPSTQYYILMSSFMALICRHAIQPWKLLHSIWMLLACSSTTMTNATSVSPACWSRLIDSHLWTAGRAENCAHGQPFSNKLTDHAAQQQQQLSSSTCTCVTMSGQQHTCSTTVVQHPCCHRSTDSVFWAPVFMLPNSSSCLTTSDSSSKGFVYFLDFSSQHLTSAGKAYETWIFKDETLMTIGFGRVSRPTESYIRIGCIQNFLVSHKHLFIPQPLQGDLCTFFHMIDKWGPRAHTDLAVIGISAHSRKTVRTDWS